MHDFQIKLRYTHTTENFDDGDFEFTKKRHLAKKVKWIWAPFMFEFYASGRITAPILDTGNWQSIDKKPVGCAGLLISA